MRGLRNAIALLCVVGLAVAAAPKPTTHLITDAPDDANGANCWTTGLCGSGTRPIWELVPGSVPQADVRHVRATSLSRTTARAGVRAVTGIEVRAALTANPYRVEGEQVVMPMALVAVLSRGNCSLGFTARLTETPTEPRRSSVWLSDDCAAPGDYSGQWIRDRWDARTNELVIVVDLTRAPKALRNTLPLGARIRGVNAWTRTALPFPASIQNIYFDEAWAAVDGPVWRVGSDVKGRVRQGY